MPFWMSARRGLDGTPDRNGIGKRSASPSGDTAVWPQLCGGSGAWDHQLQWVLQRYTYIQ